MILNSFLYYVLFCSSVLIYGIGFHQVSVLCESPKKIILGAIKSFSCVIISYLFSYGINKTILIPLSIIELYPFIALLLFISISVFFEILIEITIKKNFAEFSVCFLSLLLALNEGITLLDGILICMGILTCFYALLPVLFAIDKKMSLIIPNNVLKRKSIIFLSMILIMLALYSFNISWLNTGVIK